MLGICNFAWLHQGVHIDDALGAAKYYGLKEDADYKISDGHMWPAEVGLSSKWDRSLRFWTTSPAVKSCDNQVSSAYIQPIGEAKLCVIQTYIFIRQRKAGDSMEEAKKKLR